MSGHAGDGFVAPPPLPEFGDAERIARATAFADRMALRRSHRAFSDRDVPQEVIDAAIRAAGSAPSGANMQPWHFVVVRDPDTKARIRQAAEAEERAFYERRAPAQWLEALAPLGTDARKPFLTTAPVLIACFYQRWFVDEAGRRRKTYYSIESAGLACGLLIAALHEAGLATLTHTPSPMRFLRDILGRPAGELPLMLLVVGHPAPGERVPDLRRKPLDEIRTVV